MANVTITTNVAELFSHDVYFEFVVQDSSVDSYSVNLEDIGDITYEHEVPNDGEDTTKVGVRGGDLEVTLDNYITVSSLLIDVLESAYDFDDTEIWYAKMYYKLKEDATYTEIPFLFSRNDIGDDFESQTVTIHLQPYLSPDKTRDVDTFLSDISLDADLYFTETDLDAAAIAGEFLEYAIHYLYRIDNSFPKGTTVFASNVFLNTHPTSGTEWFVAEIPIEGAGTVISVIELTGRLAALESAIFGNALGTPYYVGRKTTANSITIDTDDITHIKRIPFWDAQYNFLTVSNGVQIATASSLRNAEKEMSIIFGANGSTKRTIIDTDTISDTDSSDATIVNEGLLGYYTAFGFGNEEMVELDVWGIDGIYPYSVLTFDANAPDYVQSKNFRIKKIKYSFKKDTAKMIIYQI